jgi:septum formation protein
MAEQEERTPVLRLASASPRRRQLLELVGIPHIVTPADIDETRESDESAPNYVCRLAMNKAIAVHLKYPDLPVLGADTTVSVDDQILEKPHDEEDCVRMLSLLSGREHDVLTGFCIVGKPWPSLGPVRTIVRFRRISPAEMRAYWATGEPQGKAGAYAIQGLGAVFVKKITGSYTNVMGLPLFEVCESLQLRGIPIWNGLLPRLSEGE